MRFDFTHRNIAVMCNFSDAVALEAHTNDSYFFFGDHGSQIVHQEPALHFFCQVMDCGQILWE